MSWTPWKKIADRLTWYQDHAMFLPVCYELGVGEPGQGPVDVVYAATTPSERQMMEEFAAGGTPISDKLTTELNAGREIFFRCQGLPTPDAGAVLLSEALAARPHPWND
jgi:hypothetical protein